VLILLCLAGAVQTSNDPERTMSRLGYLAGAMLIIGAVVFAIRGDFFRSSGLDDSGDTGCGMARSC
jgi:hypothetical protein